MTPLSPEQEISAQTDGIALGCQLVLKDLIEFLAMTNPILGDAIAERWRVYLEKMENLPQVEPYHDAVLSNMNRCIEECSLTARTAAEAGRAVASDIAGN